MIKMQMDIIKGYKKHIIKIYIGQEAIKRISLSIASFFRENKPSEKVVKQLFVLPLKI